jgi:hypothetical protein
MSFFSGYGSWVVALFSYSMTAGHHDTQSLLVKTLSTLVNYFIRQLFYTSKNPPKQKQQIAPTMNTPHDSVIKHHPSASKPNAPPPP